MTSMSLKGKTLFITGASRGIGLAIPLRAARDGANIAIAAKTETAHPKLEGTIHSAAEAIEQGGGQALPLVVDVRDEAAVKSAIAQTVTRLGSLNIVVSNASAISLTPVAQTDMKRLLDTAHKTQPKIHSPREPGFSPRVNRFSTQNGRTSASARRFLPAGLAAKELLHEHEYRYGPCAGRSTV